MFNICFQWFCKFLVCFHIMSLYVQFFILLVFHVIIIFIAYNIKYGKEVVCYYSVVREFREVIFCTGFFCVAELDFIV